MNNYNLGQTIVRNYIEKNGGAADQPEKRWQIFSELLSEPHTPSSLNQECFIQAEAQKLLSFEIQCTAGAIYVGLVKITTRATV